MKREVNEIPSLEVLVYFLSVGGDLTEFEAGLVAAFIENNPIPDEILENLKTRFLVGPSSSED